MYNRVIRIGIPHMDAQRFYTLIPSQDITKNIQFMKKRSIQVMILQRDFTEQDAKLFAEYFSQCTVITLIFDSHHMNMDSVEYVLFYLFNLGNNSLERLILDNFPLANIHLELISAICTNTPIKYLHLRNCGLGSKNLDFICDSMKKGNVKYIRLNNNQLCDTQLEDIVKILENHELEYLNISNNPLSAICMQQIIQNFFTNVQPQKSRKLDITNIPMNKPTKEYVVKHSNQTTRVIYHNYTPTSKL